MKHITPRRVQVRLVCGHSINVPEGKAYYHKASKLKCFDCRRRQDADQLEINIIEDIKKNNFSGDMFVLLRINNQEDAQLVEFLKQIANGGQRWSAVKDFFLRTARAAMRPFQAGDESEQAQDPQVDLALDCERKG